MIITNYKPCLGVVHGITFEITDNDNISLAITQTKNILNGFLKKYFPVNIEQKMNSLP